MQINWNINLYIGGYKILVYIIVWEKKSLAEEGFEPFCARFIAL